jgi:hypothetical protein
MKCQKAEGKTMNDEGIKIRPELLEALERKAKALGVPVEQLVDEALAEFIKRNIQPKLDAKKRPS